MRNLAHRRKTAVGDFLCFFRHIKSRTQIRIKIIIWALKSVPNVMQVRIARFYGGPGATSVDQEILRRGRVGAKSSF